LKQRKEKKKLFSANGTAATYLNFVDIIVVFVAAGKVRGGRGLWIELNYTKIFTNSGKYLVLDSILKV
jgi:hypothetical protein